MTTSTGEAPLRSPATGGAAPVRVVRPCPDDGPDLADLVRRAADGEHVAWQTIVERYSRLLWSVARRHRLSDAQAADAVQATWLRLVENLDAIRNPGRLPGWLRTTARRECLDIIRRTGREHLADPSAQDSTVVPIADRDDVGPEASVLRRERVDQVRAAVRQLPEHSQQLLELLLASPRLSYEEIGARLGMPVGSIGPTRARLLARLRTTLADTDLGDAA